MGALLPSALAFSSLLLPGGADDAQTREAKPVKVAGVATLDDEPVANATVVLIPMKEDGPAAYFLRGSSPPNWSPFTGPVLGGRATPLRDWFHLCIVNGAGRMATSFL
jgi:hypothetical protein